MTINDVHNICQGYAKLGGMHDQLERVLDDPSEETFADCNINALGRIHEWLTEIAWVRDEGVSCDASGYAEAIQEYVEAGGQTIRFGRVVNKK